MPTWSRVQPLTSQRCLLIWFAMSSVLLGLFIKASGQITVTLPPQPTDNPNQPPTTSPTRAPATPQPTSNRTPQPNSNSGISISIWVPRPTPTRKPTTVPTNTPTPKPSRQVTGAPTSEPTSQPTNGPKDTTTDAPIANTGDDDSTSSNAKITVGAYYYPWHKRHFEDAKDGYLRRELQPRQEVRLGEYDDTQPTVIRQHLAWSRQANIKVWVTSWWGQSSPEDATLRQVILPELERQAQTAPDYYNHKLAILYETMAWFNGIISNDNDNDNDSDNDSDNDNAPPTSDPFRRIFDDFEHICRFYVDHPNYYKIGGKPVVVVYLTRLLEDKCAVPQVIDRIRRGCGSNHELYIIGDHMWGEAPSPSQEESILPLMDGITNYDLYGNMGRPAPYAGSSRVALYFENARDWKRHALEFNTSFVPAVSPGYNDRAVRFERDHPALSRRLTADSPEGSLFREQLGHAINLVDRGADNLLLVNSFNEWHEDTQIEPCDGKAAKEPAHFTQGLEYQGYGTLYLDILANFTAAASNADNIFGQESIGASKAPSQKATSLPIHFTGRPYAIPTLAAMYYFPSNYEQGLRARLNQAPLHQEAMDAMTNEEKISDDFWLSWRSNIPAWVMPWFHRDHSTNQQFMEVFNHNLVKSTNHKLILYYHVSSRLPTITIDGTPVGFKQQPQHNVLAISPWIVSDVEYLCEHYLTDEGTYYHSSSGKPVVMLGLTHELKSSPGVLASLVTTIRTVASDQFSLELLLVGDDIAWSDAPLETHTFEPFSWLDGIANINVYGNMMDSWNDTTTADHGDEYFEARQSTLDAYYEQQRQWRIAAWNEGCSFLPTVVPGYNDRASGEATTPLSRVLAEEPGQEGSLFAYSLETAQHLLDSELEDLLLINSFNNFLDDTQVYPVYGSAASFPDSLTGGLVYEAYGETYLDILTVKFGLRETGVPTASPQPSAAPTPTPVEASSPGAAPDPLDWCEN